MTTLILILIIILATVGFSVAFSVSSHKKSRKVMTCHLGDSCDDVIRSEYSYFLGLPVEFLGMAYYAFIILAHLLFLAFPFLVAPIMIWVMTMSTTAVLFSLYLVFIQAHVLREWCEWCLISAAVTVLIFLAEIWGLNLPITGFLAENTQALSIMFSLSASVGVGAGIITNVLLFKFLRDLKISNSESSILKAVAQVVWLALAGLVMSTVALYLVGQGPLVDNARLIIYSVMILLLVVTEGLLNLWISPRMIRASYGQMHTHTPSDLRRARKYAFAMGSVSIVSWFALFVIESFTEIQYSLSVFLPVFLAVLVLVILFSQLADRAIASDRV